MTYDDMIRKYLDNEQTCCVCHDPLPAHQTWPGARHPFCGKPECSTSLKAKQPFSGKENSGLAAQVGRYIGPNEHKCEGPDCNNFIPEGRYDRRADFLTCCGECWIRRRTKGNRLLMCGCGCGKEFRGKAERLPINGLYFFNSKHYGAYQQEQYLESCWGVFQEIFRNYLEGFATLHYRDCYTVRNRMGPFGEFLNLEGITSLEDVTPKFVTQYLAWGVKNDRRSVARSISFVSTFFKWAIAEGLRKAGNPVVPLIHCKRQPKRVPRPLSAEQMSFAWNLLEERGNARLRLTTAIGEEGGARIGEICRMQLSDVDEIRQRILIRLPNKGGEERWMPYSDKTKKYLKEWLTERDPDCGHNLLLHNTRGNPCRPGPLGQEFNRVMCKSVRGRQYHETGFGSWSTHALRHTMASNLVSAGADAATVMAVGGWRTYEAMCGYARVDTDLARRGYDAAMKLAREQKQSAPRKRSLSLAEFQELRRKA